MQKKILNSKKKERLVKSSEIDVLKLSKEPIHRLFEKRAREIPNQIAIVCGEVKITYGELNKQANQLARFLIKQKNTVSRDQIVILCMDRSIQMLKIILAIWKCKMAYSLIDHKLPDERKKSMIELINPLFILTKNEFIQDIMRISSKHVINIDEILKNLYSESDRNFNFLYSNDELAYVFFTSGSTGKLKGALLEHAGVLNHLISKLRDIKATENITIAQTANQNFNIFNWQSFGALVLGGKTVIYSDEILTSASEFIQKIEHDGVNILQITPSYLAVLLDALDVKKKAQKLELLKMLLVTGEEAISCIINKWFEYYPNIPILNSYGCAEVSDDSLHYVVRKRFNSNRKIPIGKPILNTIVYIVKEDEQSGWKLCTMGEIGEIWLSGIGVGRGYISDEEETNKCYVLDPIGTGQRSFRTGDMGRWLSDGNVEYIGRLDFQIKVYGRKIDLSTIESVLSKHEFINQCVLIANKCDNRTTLTAYYVLKSSFNIKEFYSVELKKYLTKYFPIHMIPSFFICVDALPLTPSGKIDRGKLILLPLSDMSLEENYIAPRNDAEQILTKIWKDLLKLNHIGIKDNFFSLGGDSIVGIQVISRVRELGLDINLKQLVNYPTIEGLTREIKEEGQRLEIKIEQGLVNGKVLLTPIQRWFFSQKFSNPNHFNQAYSFKFKKPLKKDLIIQIFKRIIKQHDILRMRYYRNKNNEWIQKFSKKQESFNIEVAEFNLSNLSEKEAEQIIKINNTNIQEGLDIKNGPTTRFGLYTGHLDGYQRLVIVIHHLLVDGISWRIILEDFERIYDQLTQREKIKLSPKTSSYKSWASMLNIYAKSKELYKEWDYWLSIGKEASGLPIDYGMKKAGTNKEGKIGSYIVNLSEKETKLLINQVSYAYNTQVNDILLSALALACWKWTGRKDLLLHLEGHGREDCVKGVDVSRTVGWFTSLFPVHLKLPDEEGSDQDKYLSEVIRSIKEQLRKIPNKGIGYGVLRYLSQDGRAKKLAKIDKAQISFNYLGQMEAGRSEGNQLQFSREPIGRCTAAKNHYNVPIDITGIISNNHLFLIFDYSKDLYYKKTIQNIANMFKTQLQAIMAHCVNLKTTVYTPSDFPLADLNQAVLDKIAKDKRNGNGFENIETIYQLSPLQEGLLFHALYAPESDQYCMQMQWEYEVEINSLALKKSWDYLLNRYAVFRSWFLWEDIEKPIQIVQKSVTSPWFEEDWSSCSEKIQQEKLKEYLIADRLKGFSISKPCLLRLHLIKLKKKKYVFICTHHHILFDGWCLLILFKELCECYKSIIKEKEPRLPRIVLYAKYIEWLRKQDKEGGGIFWKKQLEGVEKPTDLGINKSYLSTYKPIKDLKKKIYYYSEEFTDLCVDFAKKSRVTLSAVIELAWGTVLSRYSNQYDVVLGSIVSGRPTELPYIENIVGLLINAIPIRLIICKNKSVREHLIELHKKMQESNHYSYLSLNEIQAQSKIPKSNPLFYSLFVFESYQADKKFANELDNEVKLTIKNFDEYQKSNYPLSIIFVSGNRLMLKIVYDGECFEDDCIDRLILHIGNILKWIIENDEKKIVDAELLSVEEKRKLLIDWNRTEELYPRKKTIQQLFEEQVKKTPEKVAVVFEDQELTYSDLNIRANQLANYLRNRKECKNLLQYNLIGICVERGLEMMVGILGILKSGGAYVPLDPKYPQERLRFMLEDTKINLLLTQKSLLKKLSFLTGSTETKKNKKLKLMCLDFIKDLKEINKSGQDNPFNINKSTDLACVIYTSGSTGVPKGVLIEQKGIIRLVKNTNFVVIKENDCIAQLSNISFDAATFEIWVALLNGAKLLCINSQEIFNVTKLKKILRKNYVSILFMVSGLFRQYALEDPSVFNDLNYLLVGGDVLDPKAVNSLRGNSIKIKHILNGYGPTENTIFSTTYNIKDQIKKNNSISIGKFVSNTIGYVLDENMKLVSIGISGELYVGGEGLARGYLNRSKLTAKKFIKNPFVTEIETKQGRNLKLYKTGDLVRWLPDGNLEFIGRIDDQVKIRGFRVELGEIEVTLSSYKGISKSVVIAGTKEKKEQLIAYYVLDKNRKYREVASAVSVGKLITYLEKWLPDYMIPSHFVELDFIPLTINGKTDKRALVKLDNSITNLDSEYVAPRTEKEKVLSKIWCDVLKLDRVGIKNIFFYLGGNSLNAIQVISRINRIFHVDCPLEAVFKYKTIADLSRYLYKRLSGMEDMPVLIKVADRSKRLPLSFAQQRLWFLDQYEEGYNANYNIPITMRLKGNLNLIALEKSFNKIIERYESLRTTFKNKKGEPIQKIKGKYIIRLKSEKIIKEDLENILLQEAVKPFDLSIGPLIRIKVFKLGKKEHELMVTQHHIISDGWSIDILLKELAQLYNACIRGESQVLSKLRIQYADFAYWQRNWLQGEVLERQVKYWKNKLRDFPLLEFPTDFARPSIKTYNGSCYRFVLNHKLMKESKELGNKNDSTLFMVLLSTFNILLWRYSGQEDLVIGTIVANRNHEIFEEILGFFVNTLPLRTDLSGKPNFVELLRRIKKTCLEAYSHQDIPFERLLDVLDIERNTSRDPIFQIMFVLQNTTSNNKLNLINLKTRHEKLDCGMSKFDLTFTIIESNDGLECEIEYNIDLYRKETIEDIARHFKILLGEVVKNPNQFIHKYEILTVEERNKILFDWNNINKVYPRDKTIHQLFEEQVEKRPNETAVIFEDKELSYNDLNIKANKLAHYLRGEYKSIANRKPLESILIGLYVEKSLDMIVGILGVLKFGGTCVPISIDYPDERIKYIINDAKLRCVLIGEKFEKRLSSLAFEENKISIVAINSNEVQKQFKIQSQSNPKKHVIGTSLAYVMYTSGTMGNPKGVMIEHRGIVSLVKNVDYINIYASDSIAQFADIAFDAAIFEIWGALLNGAKLFIPTNKIDLFEDVKIFQRILIRNKISILWLTKTVFDLLFLMNENIFKNLRYLLVGGEALNKDLVLRLVNIKNAPKNVINGYGPTENTTFSCALKIKKQDIIYAKSVPIGKPLTNRRAYVLDANLNLLPVGAIGELYVGGEGLARGYLNNSKLTAEKFVINPFQTKRELQLGKNSRLYKTGDLGRWLLNGNLEYVGRNDFQIKIRGYRVELEEIEKVISTYDGIKQSVVIVKECKTLGITHKDLSNNKYLVGYYVTGELTNKKIKERDLFNYLQSKLPNYMVPSVLIQLRILPTTINGKLNRKALPEPKIIDCNNYVSPRNNLEKNICQIWGEILYLSQDQVGIRDDFFKLGGDSISAIRLVSLLKQRKKLSINVKDVFRYRNIEKIYDNVLSKNLNQNIKPALINEQENSRGKVELSPIQRWFFANNFKMPHHWNQSFLIKTPKLNVKRLQESIIKLIERHDGFRLRFKREKNSHVQFYEKNIKVEELKTLSIKQLKEKEDTEGFKLKLQEIFTTWQNNFNLEKGPLCRFGYVDGYIDGSSRVYFALHHLIVDTVSWRILAEDLRSIYNQEILCSKGNSYQQWSDTIRKYANANKNEKTYWINIICDYSDQQSNNLLERHNIKNHVGSVLSKELTRRLLRESSGAYHTEINDLLLTALGYSLNEITNNKIHHIILEGHGREIIDDRIDITRTLGWFTTMYPVRIEIQNDIGASIKTIKEDLRKIPNKGIGYGILMGYKNNVLPKIIFNYLGQFGGESEKQNGKDFWIIADENSGISIDKDNLDKNIVISIDSWIIEGKFKFNIGSQLSRKLTNRFARIFKQKLKTIIAHCSTTTVKYTESDFINVKGEMDLLELPLLPNSNQYDWFEMTEMQKAFLLGRLSYYEIGNVANHIYKEYYYESLDIKKLEEVINILVRKQPTLRTIYSSDRLQQRFLKLEEIKKYKIKITDYSNRNLNDNDIKVIRDLLSHKVYNTEQFPLFIFEVTRFKDFYVLHSSMDLILLDAESRRLLFDSINGLYRNDNFRLDIPNITFKDYQDYYQLVKHSIWHQNDRKYWMNNIKQMPFRPELPFKIPPEQIEDPLFADHTLYIENDIWTKFKSKAEYYNVSYSAVLLGLYGSVIAYFSGYKEFLITMTLFNRYAFHDQVSKVWGDFTSTNLFHYVDLGRALKAKLKRTHEVIWNDISHALYTGLEVQRELAKLNTLNINKSVSPIIFTGLVGGKANKYKEELFLENNELLDRRYDLAQTSQAWIDLQAIEVGDRFMSQWLYVTQLFDKEYIAQLNGIYCGLIKHFAENDWEDEVDLFSILKKDEAIVEQANGYQQIISEDTLFSRYERLVIENSYQNNISIIDVSAKKEYCYQHLMQDSNLLAKYLFNISNILSQINLVEQNNHNFGKLIGVLCEKGYNQAVSILAIMKSNHGYLPLSIDWPIYRLDEILAQGNIIILLISRAQYNQKHIQEFLSNKYRLLVIEDILLEVDIDKHLTKGINLPGVKPDDIAYVIFTSGSTGKPKGVTISHRGALNTIDGVNNRFNITHKDRVIALAELCFDLSVYDIFGILARGGTIVFPEQKKVKDPRHWLELIDKYKITLCNMVPQLADLLINEAVNNNLHTIRYLRLFFLSGDWITVSLPDRIRRFCNKAIVVSLGGPTEGSIWSIWYKIDKVRKDWKSIPYGVAMPNQKMYLLNHNSEHCPIGVKGEMYIGGLGVALNYWNDKDKTDESFIRHDKLGRLYKTGDLGKWNKDGYIEFLGRYDNQVKIGGYRIELGEIDYVLANHSLVQQSITLTKKDRSNNMVLVSYIVPKLCLESNMEVNIKLKIIEEIKNYISNKLPDYMNPLQIIILEKMPLTQNGKIDKNALLDFKLEKISLEQKTYKKPKTKLEEDLCQVWEEVLNLPKKTISTQDNFFQLGGNSILAIQLMSKINRHAKVRLPIGWLFAHATIQEQVVTLNLKRRDFYQPVITFSTKGKLPPLFFVHPGYGEAGVYRDFAEMLGSIRPFYAIDSHNLCSNSSFITTIEGLALCYIKYIKNIQPVGPYYLGGWSLGGLIAYEIAQQMLKLGDKINIIYLLDTFLLSTKEKKLFTEAKSGMFKLFKNSNLHHKLAQEYKKRFSNVYNIENNAMLQYQAKPYNGKVILFKATEMELVSKARLSKKEIESCLKFFRVTLRNKNNGWGLFAKHLNIEYVAECHSNFKSKNALKSIIKRFGSNC